MMSRIDSAAYGFSGLSTVTQMYCEHECLSTAVRECKSEVCEHDGLKLQTESV